MNPAAAVRGPRHVVKTGKTPVLSPDETRRILDGIDTAKIVGLRDRALIGVLVFTFARISAAVVSLAGCGPLPTWRDPKPQYTLCSGFAKKPPFDLRAAECEAHNAPLD